MNSWRFSSVMWPVRVRKSIPANHSSSVSATSEANACRCETRLRSTSSKAPGPTVSEAGQNRLGELLVGEVAGAHLEEFYARCQGWRRGQDRPHSDRGAVTQMPDTTATTPGPLTGEEYLESLRDGREVYVYGERVKDVTTHPAFRNTARSIARLYDALHDPATRDVITTETDTGSGGLHPQVLPLPARRRRTASAICDAIAAVGAAELRLAGAQPRLQGGVPGHARAPTPTSTSPTRTTPGAGTRRRRSGSCT